VESPFRRIAIVGFGLIGGSLGLALRRAWADGELVAIERDIGPAAVSAMRAGFQVEDSLEAATGADLVVLAAPVAQNIALMEALASILAPTAIVTDVGSTKRAILARACEMAPSFAFVGGHPLAGDAPGGFERARADLFTGRPWLLTPLPGEPHASALGRVSALAAAVGAHPRIVDAREHDRVMAYVSHLPQLVASTLMHTVGSSLVDSTGLSLAGTGLTDTTRLAASPASMWLDILATNADEISAAVDVFVDALRESHPAVGSHEARRAILESGNHWRRELEARVGFQTRPREGRTERVTATRYCLELLSLDALQPAEFADQSARVERMRRTPPSFFRYLYREVGRRYQWVDRLDWSDDQIARHLAAPDIEIWLLRVAATPAGYFELKRTDDGSAEIAYFGLLDEFIGQGYGRPLLTAAVRAAWTGDTRRVWLHTCSLDHPAALRNYLSCGFTVFKQEQYETAVSMGR
jgi:prephenate dehydrogenase/GNAT superfamily N-acetyltransferase